MPTQKEVAQQQQLLAQYRRNLSHYLFQLSQVGIAYASPGVLNGIDEARSNISRIKSVLRSWGVYVEDHPDDTDSSEPDTQNPIDNPPVSVDRIKLRDIL